MPFFNEKHNIFKAASCSIMVYVRTNTLMCYIKNKSSLHSLNFILLPRKKNSITLSLTASGTRTTVSVLTQTLLVLFCLVLIWFGLLFLGSCSSSLNNFRGCFTLFNVKLAALLFLSKWFLTLLSLFSICSLIASNV